MPVKPLTPDRPPIRHRLPGHRSVEERLAEFGPGARERWKPYFHAAGVNYPPARLVLAGFKHEMTLQVFGANKRGRLKLIRELPIVRGSGVLGPKTREGDGQVPEGLYKIELLNPNSSYHLSLRINYPNREDRRIARQEGRTNLGGDIMIHGRDVSIGCLAMGDLAAEDLFVLAAENWPREIPVILSPLDFRRPGQEAKLPPGPQWLRDRYTKIKRQVLELPQR